VSETPVLQRPVAPFAGLVKTEHPGGEGTILTSEISSTIAGGGLATEPLLIHEKTRRCVVPAYAELSVNDAALQPVVRFKTPLTEFAKGRAVPATGVVAVETTYTHK
jgi:hypothetical protein